MEVAVEGQRANFDTRRLVAVTFFAVCGGPYGLEPAVRTGGPLLTLFGCLALPWLWGLPQALLTAELSRAIPSDGGPVVWVHRAFGSSIAEQFAFCSLIASIQDTALYPIMFADYVQHLLSAEMLAIWAKTAVPNSQFQWLASMFLIVFVAILNLRPVHVVGTGAISLSVLVMAPFVLLACLWLSMGPDAWLNSERFMTTPALGERDRLSCLAVLLWSHSGYDSAGSIAGDVHAPGNDYLKALIAVILLTMLAYILPLCAGVLGPSSFDLRLWHDGYWVTIAGAIGGTPLRVGVVLGGAASAAGMFSTGLLANARNVAAAARLGVLPPFLGQTLREESTDTIADGTKGVPVRAVLGLATAAAMLNGCKFEALISASMGIFGLRQALQFAALVRLRHTEPLLPRPFRIPLGDAGPGLFLLALPAFILAAISIVDSRALVGTFAVLAASAVSALLRRLFCSMDTSNESWHSDVELLPRQGMVGKIR